MPPRTTKPCRNRLCRNTTASASGYCETCEPKAEAERRAKEADRNKARGSATERGYGIKWQRARAAYLKKLVLQQQLRVYPCCELCLKKGVITEATIVDHVVPHKGDKQKFWDAKNWQGLCARCHAVKTAKEDGGFGNVSKQ